MMRMFVGAWRLLAAAIYVSVALGSPIAHAHSEELSSDPVIEAGHSGTCSVLHVESACTTSSAFEDPGSRTAARYAARPAAFAPIPPASVSVTRIPFLLNTVSERGPPTSRS
jgi:hypothetical protein